MKYPFLFFFISFFLTFSLRGQQMDAETLADTAVSAPQVQVLDKLFRLGDRVLSGLTVGERIFIPAVVFAPETSVGLGVKSVKIAEKEGGGRPNTYPFTFLYTLNNQWILSAEADIWTKADKQHIFARVEFNDYPFFFFGTGANPLAEGQPYSSRFARVFVSAGENYFHRHLYGGAFVRYRRESVYAFEANGLFDDPELLGIDPFQQLTIGVQWTFDSRDNLFYPTRGVWATFRAGFSVEGLLSDFENTTFEQDIRAYRQIGTGGVLAAQLYHEFQGGDVPFTTLSQFGGANLMRGYFRGRHRDSGVLAFQAELRQPLYKKLSIAIFSGLGTVYRPGEVAPLRASGGLGARYRLSENGLQLRIDLAYGDALKGYFGLNEAF
ncbi:Outer membrane protein/protective antigen OMA87-like protein [Nitritalea halalkaliphila LW7]|uniref:Outer membrane protein/protective antigen OMA87-like protein n=1 Tax=Nitritalea halalkaliphila LW7 TaxID=1189621 RepID=I5C155_9BACT|nr:BamA/TamA family outer membrane protein [Nitritalea halalkaliphila]EIM75557.1 Outer membrane protein/protective antigen OMA87-like protein [Nitritalea halalkaliphila LW7]